MVSSVVNSLIDRLHEAFPASTSYGPSDFSGNPMPGPIADYLKHEMRVRLMRAAPAPGQDSWVDAQHGEVRQARSKYLDVLASHQRIPAREWQSVLERACEETVRVLIWPSSGLTDIVFANGARAVEPEDLLSRLDYFSSYPYFREVVEAYFEQKEIATIDRERFEGLINRIDRQMTTDYGPAEWMRLLRPLLAVLRAAGHREDLPADVIAAFLEEKGADEALGRLRSSYESDGYVPLAVLSDIFRADAGDGASATTQRTEAVSVEGHAAERDPMPLWKQFEQGRPVPADEPVVEPSRSSSAGAGEPLWKQFRSGADPRPARPESDLTRPTASMEDLERAVLGSRGARNRDLFVRHLFSGDRDEYESTLRKLQHIRSWSEASKVIARDVFLKHQVNIYSDPAVAFTDAAESRYRS